MSFIFLLSVARTNPILFKVLTMAVPGGPFTKAASLPLSAKLNDAVGIETKGAEGIFVEVDHLLGNFFIEHAYTR
jgi:hypothetical protein